MEKKPIAHVELKAHYRYLNSTAIFILIIYDLDILLELIVLVLTTWRLSILIRVIVSAGQLGGF